MIREFKVIIEQPYSIRLQACKLDAMALKPLVSALADMQISNESFIYPELMYHVAAKCEQFLTDYYNDKGEK